MKIWNAYNWSFESEMANVFFTTTLLEHNIYDVCVKGTCLWIFIDASNSPPRLSHPLCNEEQGHGDVTSMAGMKTFWTDTCVPHSILLLK